MDKWKNSNFPWFWQVGTYSLGSAQCHIQGQVIGAGLKTITEIGNKGLHIITSFDWVQISFCSCPPKLRPCIRMNQQNIWILWRIDLFCLPTFWSTFGGWVNRFFRWRVRWIERSRNSWSPPQTSSPKNSTQRSKNTATNLRCDGIEQWNFNQPPTTPGVPLNYTYGDFFFEMIEVVWTRPSRCLNVHFNVVCLTRLELQSNLCIQKWLKL